MKTIRAFFAVDNSVNEHTVMGAFWTLVSVGVIVAKACGVESLDSNVLYITLGASLGCFGIGGFKKG